MSGKDFDEVLERIGGMGRYQKFLILLLGVAAIPMGAMNLSNVFISGLPDYFCRIPELGNLTEQAQKEISAPPIHSAEDGDAETKYDACEVYDVDYGALDLSLNSTDYAHLMSNETGLKRCEEWTYDDSVFENTIVTRWNLVCSSQWMKSMAQSIYMLGYLIGAVGFGAIADRFGRRPAFFLALCCFLVSGVVAALMPTYWSHVALRLITGAAAAGGFTIGFVIQMEMIGVSHRMIPGILYQGWFAIGYMSLAVIAYFVRNYVHLQLVLSLSVVLFVPYYWLLGESPRWLMTIGRLEDCGKEVKKAAKRNKSEYPADLLRPKSIVKHEDDEAEEQEQEHEQGSLIDLLKTPNMRWKTLNILFNWFVNSFVYYGLTLGVSALPGSIYTNLFISGAVEFVGFIPCMVLLDRIGRRLPLALMLATAGTACVFMAIVPQEYAIITTCLSMLGKLSISGSFAIIYVFSAELFPTVARSSGVGAGSTCARVGSLLAPFLADLIHVWRPLPFLVFGIFSLAAGVLTMLLPETFNRHLPETLEDGENFTRGKFEWYAKPATAPGAVISPSNTELLKSDNGKENGAGESEALKV